MIMKKGLYEYLEVEPSGIIYMNQTRSIILSISSFGMLRKDLINNIGKDRTKGFLIRFGWQLGQEHAKKVLQHSTKSLQEIIESGPDFHTMKGHVIAKTSNVQLEFINNKISIIMEGIWERSYEAEEHIKQFGISEKPVCYTLTGYASGYISTICNQTVIFKEMCCAGSGHKKCKWIGKSLDYWDEEIEDELRFYHEEPILEELEMTYDKLLEERNNLAITSAIHKQLTEEILKGQHLDSIVRRVYKTLEIPILIADKENNLLTHTGLSEENVNQMEEEFTLFIKKNINSSDFAYKLHFCTTKLIHLNTHSRLITPIFLQENFYGYCSFIYLDPHYMNVDLHEMIIERISFVCSLYLLNQKTKMEASMHTKGYFLEEILQEEYHSEEEIIRKGRLIDLDLSDRYRIVVVKYTLHLQKGNVNQKLTIHEKIMEATSNYFKNKQNMLITQKDSSIILHVMNRHVKNGDIQTFCEELIQFLTKTFPAAVFFVGISKIGDQLTLAHERYNEALIALRMTSLQQKIVTFDSVGIIGPLINQNNKQEIKQVAENILYPLLKNLDSKRIELLKTLYIFLVNGGNLEQTASDAALSLSGLRYRLAKIEGLLDKNLRDPIHNYQLLTAIQALILIDELKFD